MVWTVSGRLSAFRSGRALVESKEKKKWYVLLNFFERRHPAGMFNMPISVPKWHPTR